MPNIELFGFRSEIAENLIKSIKEKIKESNKISSILSDVVFTKHTFSVVTDGDDSDSPFVRITSIPRDDLDDLAEILCELNVDVGVMILDRFIPAGFSHKEE